jgi:hypothetical protein
VGGIATMGLAYSHYTVIILINIIIRENFSFLRAGKDGNMLLFVRRKSFKIKPHNLRKKILSPGRVNHL